MTGRFDYLLAQVLSLVFYGITLAVFHRARRAYAGGKIGAAIHLVFVFLVVLLLADIADYFLPLLLPAGSDIPLIARMMLRLTAVCILFFGGLRFFTPRPRPATDAPAVAPSPRPEDPAAGTRPQGDTAAAPASGSSGPTLGRYRVVGELGRGSSGLVYKGIDPELERTVAIKTIRFSDDVDEAEIEAVRERFYHEAKILAQLSHPNIVAVYDVGEELDLTYLGMEYLEGENLEPFTRKGLLLSVSHCVRIVQQVCAALEYLHGNGIVHRDIKPSNIVLLHDGRVKLADFGIARAMSAGTRTASGIIKGTPHYMSPEQVEGRRLTGASDIFSLGVVFYQLLTGRLPFEADNVSAVMYQITQGLAPSPADHNPELDPDIVAVVDRALQKAPELRFATAGDMTAALRDIARGKDHGEPEWR